MTTTLRFALNRYSKILLIICFALFHISSIAAAQQPVDSFSSVPALTAVEPIPSTTTFQVVVRMSGPTSRKVFTLANPPRLIIDLTPATASMELPATLPLNDPQVPSLRIGAPVPGSLRLVFDLAYFTPYTVDDIPNEPGAFSVNITRYIETRDTRSDIAPGVTYIFHQGMTDIGPLTYHALDIDLAQARPVFEVAMAQDRFAAKETLSSMVARRGASIGVNGGYFNMKTGQSIDLLIVNGRVLSVPVRHRAFLGFDTFNAPRFVYPRVEMSVQFADSPPWRIDRVNIPTDNGGLALYTPEYASSTPSILKSKEIVIRNRAVDSIRNPGGPVPPDGYVLSADTSLFATLSAFFQPSTTAKILITADPDISNIRYGFTAGPMLIVNSRPVAELTEDFATRSAIITGRSPRTAVGRTNDNHLLFFFVEGRSAVSAGLELIELSNLLLSFNVTDAINLDGGGSTELVIGDKIMNNVSDGKERPLANAILIYLK